MLHHRLGRLLFSFSSEVYPSGASLASSTGTFHVFARKRRQASSSSTYGKTYLPFLHSKLRASSSARTTPTT